MSRRPNNGSTFSKATYDLKRSKFDQKRRDAAKALAIAKRDEEKARDKEITAAGGLVPWVLTRLGYATKPAPPFNRRF